MVRRVKAVKTMRRARPLHDFHTAQTNGAAVNVKDLPDLQNSGLLAEEDKAVLCLCPSAEWQLLRKMTTT